MSHVGWGINENIVLWMYKYDGEVSDGQNCSVRDQPVLWVLRIIFIVSLIESSLGLFTLFSEGRIRWQKPYLTEIGV